MEICSLSSTGSTYCTEESMPRNRKRKRSSSRSSMSDTTGSRLSDTERQDVATLFGKQFQYTGLLLDGGERADECFVEDFLGDEPSICKTVWQDDNLMGMKQDLNKVKDQLSVQDIETWHAHTTKCNLAGKIIPHVKSLDVELCTQAWVKFYEILSTHRRLVPSQDFFSIHLCEAPGAFIASLNHFLVLQGFRQRWDWRATTLNPYHEANSMDAMVADDRLIRQTHSKWYFGPDGSGDLMAEGHVEGLCDLVAELKTQGRPVLLVTADGSRDCQSNPAEQEALLSTLHYCEALTACLILDQDGNLVIKMFTMFENSSVLLIFLLNIMFQEVHVVKPATSKSGNSEVYIVCLGYRCNVRLETLRKLLEITVYTPSHQLIHLPKIPPSFLTAHRLCCHTFANWQIQTIRRNVELFDTLDKGKTVQLEASQQYALEVFKSRTRLCSIRHNSKIGGVSRQMSAFQLVTSPSDQHHQPQTWSQKRLRGTFQLRQDLGHMTFPQRVKLMRAHRLPKPNLVLASRFLVDEEMDRNPWSRLEMSKLSMEVNNSRFCDVEIMQDYNTLLKDSEFQECRKATLTSHLEMLWYSLEKMVISRQTSNESALDQAASSRDPDDKDKREAVCNAQTFYFYCDELQKDSSAFQTFLDMAKRSSVVNSELVLDPLHLRTAVCNANGCVQVFADMTTLLHFPGSSEDQPLTVFEEILLRKTFLSRMLNLLKNLKVGSRLLLLTSTFLMRLTTGYLYILARCFQQVAVNSEPNLWLHQFLVLDNFQGFGPKMQEKLERVFSMLEAERSVKESGDCVMGIVETPYLLSDRKFVQFLTAYNNFTVANFVDLMLEYYSQPSSQKDTEEKET